jgi:hypothetical protein
VYEDFELHVSSCFGPIRTSHVFLCVIDILCLPSTVDIAFNVMRWLVYRLYFIGTFHGAASRSSGIGSQTILVQPADMRGGGEATIDKSLFLSHFRIFDMLPSTWELLCSAL